MLWVVLGPLGQGGMGAAYEGVHEELKVSRAIKVLRAISPSPMACVPALRLLAGLSAGLSTICRGPTARASTWRLVLCEGTRVKDQAEVLRRPPAARCPN